MTSMLAPAQWRVLEAEHSARVDAATAGHRARTARGRSHPVEDFLFRYYAHRPAKLRRWHPGAGVRLENAAHEPRAGWRHYRRVGGALEVDVEEFLETRADVVAFVHALVSATLSRPARLGCFGLHEWAMVYRQRGEEVRHRGWPLRLGGPGTDAVVEESDLRCSHVDAYRFFTAPARPRNALRPTRATQVALEQPGCLHAGMDLYKWAFTLTPLVPSSLTVDAFDLAREIRVLDMRASPYDLRSLGYSPVPVETPEGRAEYARRQRDFSERANALRRRLLDVLDRATAGPGAAVR